MASIAVRRSFSKLRIPCLRQAQRGRQAPHGRVAECSGYTRVAPQLICWAIVAVALVALAVTRSVTVATPSSGSHWLPDYGSVPGFSLTDQSGRVMTGGELDGRVWVADFIFTSCPSQCLLMTDQLRGLQRTFADMKDLRFISFSVDPEHDTPEILSAYARSHGADPRWILLTGERQGIVQLCRDGFRLSVDDGATGHGDPITHSTRFVLIDREGRIRGYYRATDAKHMAQLREDLRRILGKDA